MSRSRGDQRGKRINKEIMGRGCFDVTETGRMIKRCGGEEVGSATSKRSAKQEIGRIRRRMMNRIPTDD
jgi:hypothetical protein